MSVKCANCGFTFKNNEEVGQPCPKCGSHDRSLHLHNEVKAHVLLKLKKKGATSKHKKGRPDYELEEGKKTGKDGKLVSIERIIDRDSDRYQEIVKDENGKIIVDKDEKLSEHREG